MTASAVTRRGPLWPLFLVSLSAVGYETALTRYFAVAKWSEYGYWVISIVMVGFALSGVVMALFRDAFARNGAWMQAAAPAPLILTAAAGFHLATLVPFNPLQFQNPATWQPQLWNIAAYYACLLPFFFLAGLFVSLSFVLNGREAGRVYSYDLIGAGVGALLILGLMFALHPFALVPALLPPLALASLWSRRRASVAAAILALVAAEAVLLLDSHARVDDFKAIYAPLHTPDARVLAESRSPRGVYQLLDDFTERVDTDVSNNAGLLEVPGPPRTFGLYRDGGRIAALPMPGPLDVRYAPAALDALPYALIPGPRVLLEGASGGFRVAETLALGAAEVRALEPDPVLRGALSRGLGGSPAPLADPRATVSAASPLAALGGPFDVIDVSADFLDAAEANVAAFTVEALSADLRALRPGGIVSVPVSIRDFPVYATRMLATAREAMRAAGIDDPANHAVVYRSAWSVRVLLSPAPWDPARIATLRQWCDDRSFDVSYYPGIDLKAALSNIYNDLPPVSFTSGEVDSSGGGDAIAEEARQVLEGAATPSQAEFNLNPVTLDRPFFYAVLDLLHLRTVLKRLEILPQAEISALVNVAVLAQATVIAALVLLVPLLAPGRVRGANAGLVRPVVYFPALGLGFLFLEIYLIEKASLYLNDRASAFALVLTGMLIFSGIGSMAAHRFEADARRSLAVCAGLVVAFCLLCLVALQPALLATLSWPWAVRAVLVVAVVAAPSLALGLPFPLGLAQQGETGFLPWAWGLNGAFSVVATPLANLIARQAGFHWVLLGAAMLYLVALVTFPLARKQTQWQDQARLPAVR